MEDWMTIRNLKKKNPYMGTRKIAKLVDISRNTVIKALASDIYPSYHREPTVSVLIDPFVSAAQMDTKNAGIGPLLMML